MVARLEPGVALAGCAAPAIELNVDSSKWCQDLAPQGSSCDPVVVLLLAFLQKAGAAPESRAPLVGRFSAAWPPLSPSSQPPSSAQS